MKNVKRKISSILIIISTLFLSIFTPLMSLAAENTIHIDDYYKNINTSLKENDVDANMYKLTEKDANVDFEFMNSTSKNKQFLTDIKNNGFKETNLDNNINLSIVSNKDESIAVNVVYKLFINNTNDKVLVQLIFDNKNKQITHVIAQKLLDGHNKTSTIYEGNSEQNNLLLKNFHWNGHSFACGLTGVLACIGYCAAWHLAGGWPGVVCDVACGAAFTAACSFA